MAGFVDRSIGFFVVDGFIVLTSSQHSLSALVSTLSPPFHNVGDPDVRQHLKNPNISGLQESLLNGRLIMGVPLLVA
jgi:hypothetical protein